MKGRILLSLALVTLFVAGAFAQFTGAASQFHKSTSDVEYRLSWDVASTANTAAYRAEHYSVWISTTGTDPDDFVMLFEETLSTVIPNWEYQPRTSVINEYAGMTVYVTFRHHESTDNDRIVIDNVKLYRASAGKEDVVYLFEDFQAGIDDPAGEDWLPEGWAAVDADDDGFNWYFAVRQGEGAMRSQSWDNDAGALTPDNWLITPGVLLGSVSVGDLSRAEVSLFPNPASSYITINSSAGIRRLELVNMLGAVVMSSDSGFINTGIDVSNFKQGLYFVKLHTNEGIIIKKLNINR